jgi:transcriptional regulator with XRE-family HTH domain
MTTPFGTRLRNLRQDKGFSQKRLAAAVSVHHTYISKVESGKLDFALYPGEELVRKLAVALDADETELLLLAKKVPPLIRDRVLERPDAFRKLATLDDASLDEVIRQVDRRKKARA